MRCRRDKKARHRSKDATWGPSWRPMPCPHLAHASEEVQHVLQQSALLVPTENPLSAVSAKILDAQLSILESRTRAVGNLHRGMGKMCYLKSTAAVVFSDQVSSMSGQWTIYTSASCNQMVPLSSQSRSGCEYAAGSSISLPNLA